MIANLVLEEMVKWFEECEGRVGILDATNTQPERRRVIRTHFNDRNVEVLFLECVYDDGSGHEIALHDHVQELRLICPEYASADRNHVLADFRQRLNFYRPHYRPVGSVEEEKTVPFVHFRDGGARIIANRVVGYLRSRVLYYLMNLHNGKKRIFLFPLPPCHSEQEKTSHGGNNGPNHLGQYLEPIKDYFSNEGTTSPPAIWTETSLLSFSIAETLQGYDLLTKPQLRGQDLGLVSGLSDEQIQKNHPEDYLAYQRDPYKFRYPRAESYHDVAVRLENVIMELEKEPHDVLLLADTSVLRCIYAYFFEIANRDIPRVEIPPDSLLELSPKAYGISKRQLNLRHQEKGESNDGAFHPFQENL